MSVDSKAAYALPVPYARAQAPTRTYRIKTALKYLVLVSVAGGLSTFLPSLRSQSFEGVPKPLAAPEWKDDVWPIQEQTPWDISTDFPHPRLLEYDVTEGTWLRLDVHPKSGDIIFDMLGDVYCLAGAEVSAAAAGVAATARPILRGVPHDSDPHFSPDGNGFVFTSDAGLGVQNIWIKPWAGCEAADLRSTAAQVSKAHDEALLAQGVKETTERRANRLVREGRHEGSMLSIIICIYSRSLQRSVSPTKLIAISLMRAFIPPAPR
jgi:hypothetical protein